MMSTKMSKLRLMGAFAALATLALAVSCRGFFVKPTITAIAVGPVSPTIYAGGIDNTVQMFAVGTFNDGTSGTTSVSWSVSGTDVNGNNIATISSGGLVTAAFSGAGTITATSNVLPSISGTQPLTVSVACTSKPIIGPTTTGTLTPGQPTLVFTASCNGGQDITAVATWFSSNTVIATVSAGVVTAQGGTGNDGTFYVTASANGFTSDQVQITASSF
jgi:Bacterial Ig-like domain (group 2)